MVPLCEDSVIVFARVSRYKVVMGSLLSCGGYGNVYLGKFNNRPVAIKTLLDATKQSVDHVNSFLAEVKLMASFKHPHIVEFVGVAWDSLADLCVISEYMAGGDLRALLNVYQSRHHPIGFDRHKVDIAYQVSFALTYLHSLSLPIIHRGIKSRNVILSEDHSTAKLTDFGVSRERADSTMTWGKGTLLWMAPEVMTGGRYDEKADVFSLGVLLSELDTRSLPYARARQGASGGPLNDMALATKISSGAVRVQFSAVNASQQATAEVVQLGLECVNLAPNDRPPAAQVLYRLQCIVKKL